MKISVIVPMYNEKENAPVILQALVNSVRAWPDEYEIIAVDDNSTDSTSRILKDYSNRYGGISVVARKSEKRGMGRALVDGMKQAKGDIIVWVMGDLSDNLEKIPEMVKKIKDGYDIVFGSRYMKGG
ncbi:MAG: glycosyltransferase family 2 protein, partial [Candidatus Omnitrophota bacterium]